MFQYLKKLVSFKKLDKTENVGEKDLKIVKNAPSTECYQSLLFSTSWKLSKEGKQYVINRPRKNYFGPSKIEILAPCLHHTPSSDSEVIYLLTQFGLCLADLTA